MNYISNLTFNYVITLLSTVMFSSKYLITLWKSTEARLLSVSSSHFFVSSLTKLKIILAVQSVYISYLPISDWRTSIVLLPIPPPPPNPLRHPTRHYRTLLELLPVLYHIYRSFKHQMCPPKLSHIFWSPTKVTMPQKELTSGRWRWHSMQPDKQGGPSTDCRAGSASSTPSCRSSLTEIARD